MAARISTWRIILPLNVLVQLRIDGRSLARSRGPALAPVVFAACFGRSCGFLSPNLPPRSLLSGRSLKRRSPCGFLSPNFALRSVPRSFLSGRSVSWTIGCGCVLRSDFHWRGCPLDGSPAEQPFCARRRVFPVPGAWVSRSYPVSPSLSAFSSRASPYFPLEALFLLRVFPEQAAFPARQPRLAGSCCGCSFTSFSSFGCLRPFFGAAAFSCFTGWDWTL